jgi:hypothetical protein
LRGQYTFKIIELHKEYGPIIRISPWELHISDPDYYDEVYASSASNRKRNKYDWFTRSFGMDLAMFATVDREYFLGAEPLISEDLDHQTCFCTRNMPSGSQIMSPFSSIYEPISNITIANTWLLIDELHKIRRAALNPFFSTQMVRKLNPVIQERVGMLLQRLNGFRENGQVLNLSWMYSAFTNGTSSTSMQL